MAALPLIACAQPPPPSDEACRHEAAQVAQRCDANSLMEQCERQRLSPGCLKEVESASGARRASCKKELQQAAAPCREERKSASQQCVEQTLSPGCKERLAALERRRKACDEEVQRVWRLCKAEPGKEKQAACFERNRAAASAVCQ
jgi:hypothetical protein